MKNYSFGVLAAAVLFSLAPFTALAATVQIAKVVSVPASTVLTENAYLAGGQVNFLTTAQKDLVVAGGQVIVNGPVWGDALIAGGSIDILQPVKGDIRALGGQITVGANVSGDVVVGGGSVTILPGATVAGDVIAAGGMVDIEGTVNGAVHVRGGDVTVNSSVIGPVFITANKSVAFGDKTVIGSSLTYSAPSAATVSQGAKLGEVKFMQGGELKKNLVDVRGVFMAILGLLLFVKFVATLVAALAMVIVFKGFAGSLAESTLQKFWKTAGIGFIAIIVVPVAVILLGITVVGIYLAFALGALYFLGLLVAGVYMCVLAGALLSKWIMKEAAVDWKWAILGTLVVFLLSFVPFIGWIADALLFFAATGSIVRSLMSDAEEKMSMR